jgi:hypothetical protein
VSKCLSWFAKCTSTIIYILTLDILQHADNAQQAFSSDNVLTLHYAIPTLEALHQAWSSPADCTKFQPFASVLHAACKKIDEYYEKMTESPAYIMSMSMSFTSHPAPLTLLIYL